MFLSFRKKVLYCEKYFYQDPMSYCLCWHLTVDTSKYLIFSQTVSSWTHLPLLKCKIEVPYWEWVKGNFNLRAIYYGLVWTKSWVDYWVSLWSRHMLAFKHPAIAERPRLGLTDAKSTQISLLGSKFRNNFRKIDILYRSENPIFTQRTSNKSFD